MAEQATEESTIQPISRFSTSTTLRLTTMLEQNVKVVPMPKWSNIVGLARVALAVLVLAFTAAATAIWGGFAAFGVALFTVRHGVVLQDSLNQLMAYRHLQHSWPSPTTMSHCHANSNGTIGGLFWASRSSA